LPPFLVFARCVKKQKKGRQKIDPRNKTKSGQNKILLKVIRRRKKFSKTTKKKKLIFCPLFISLLVFACLFYHRTKIFTKRKLPKSLFSRF